MTQTTTSSAAHPAPSGARTKTSTSSLTESSKLRAFVLTFSISGPVVYCLVVFFKLPLVTYFPAIYRLVFGAAGVHPGTGPNMMWYGFTLTTILISGGLGVLATFLPERITRKYPLALVWIFPILAIPYVVYALMPWWRLAFRY